MYYLLFFVVLAGVAMIGVAVTMSNNGRVEAQKVTVRVSESTYVVQESPNTSFASRQIVQAASLNDEHATVYLKFVVPTFASHISGGTLSLLTAAAAGGKLSIHAVTNNNWSANQTSFTHRPTLGKKIVTQTGPSTVGEWVNFDLAGILTKPGTYSFAVTSESTKSVFAAYGAAADADGPQLDVFFASPDSKAIRSYAQGVQGAKNHYPPGREPSESPSGSGSPSDLPSGSPGASASGSTGSTLGPTPTDPSVPELPVTPQPGGGGNPAPPQQPPPQPPAPAPGPVVPASRTLCGSYFETPSGESYLQGFADEQSRIGVLESVRVFNPGAPSGWPGAAGSLNRTVIVSFKYNPADVIAGKEDGTMRNWFNSAPRNQDVYWSFYHEPEDNIANGEYSAEQYRDAFRHLAALAREAHNPRLFNTLILMEWSLMPQSGRNWKDYYPGSDVVDVLGWDVYNLANGSGKYTSPATVLDPLIAASKSVGKPFGIAELGAKQAPSDSSGGQRAAWLSTVATSMRNAGALWVEYFDADKSNAGRFDWRLRDGASQSAWRQFCNS